MPRLSAMMLSLFPLASAITELAQSNGPPLEFITGPTVAFEVGFLTTACLIFLLLLAAARIRKAHVRLGDYAITLEARNRELERAREDLYHLAHHDVLTHLPNRHFFYDRLGQAMAQASRRSTVLALLFIDLDRFKPINDTLGHPVGDLLLQAVAKRLTGCLRQSDTVARLGGDEFTVILTELTQARDAATVAQKIVDTLSHVYVLSGQDIQISCSIGISVFPSDGQDIETLVKNADAAVYHAKEIRNTYRFYTPDMNTMAHERARMERDLRWALDRGELVLHYQPRIELATGTVTGMEALLRWQHPELGLIAPVDFIPLAEETGLIVPIGDWVLRTACAHTKAWHVAGFPALRVAVNLSPRQFRQPGLADTMMRTIRDTGLDPRHVELELTETLIMKDPAASIATLNELNRAGVHLSIDDFGTGYSSLNYLKRFPVTALKIDRTFIRDLTTAVHDTAIVKSIIAMAHGLMLTVVAEGVETEAQRRFLHEQGCDEGQGFIFGAPVPVDAFTDWLVANRHSTTAQRPSPPELHAPSRCSPGQETQPWTPLSASSS